MPLWGGQDNLCQVPGALLQAGNETEDKSRDALLRSAYDIQASHNGNSALDGRAEARAPPHNQEVVLPVLTLYRPQCAGDAADDVCSPVSLFGSLVMHLNQTTSASNLLRYICFSSISTDKNYMPVAITIDTLES